MEQNIIGKWLKMVNFKLGNESKKWTDQHDMSVEQRKTLSPWQELNPWPPEHRMGALSTELLELKENKQVI